MLTLAFLSPSFGEMVLIAIIALLLYGSDLPQVARTWGKAYQEFRRHLNGIRNDLNDAIYAEPDSPRKLQYYPEFQNDADEADQDEQTAAPEHDSPVARAAEQAEAEAAQTNGEQPASQEPAIRHDTHGAA
jgi:sec-independent protein translocase protein TatA